MTYHPGQAQSDLSPDRLQIAEEMRSYLQKYAVRPWYPRIVDEEQGGFLSDFDAEWRALGKQDKMIVTQARHTWSPARLHRFYNEDGHFDEVADHGAEFLKYKMWDQEFGGFFQMVDRSGNALQNHNDERFIKTAYRNAFLARSRLARLPLIR